MDNYFTVISAIVASAGGILTYIIGSIHKRNEKLKEQELEFYKVKSENLTLERETLVEEEKNLRDMLREQLERCRIENERLERNLEDLKRRLINIEQELKAWELGLKVPKGFELIQLNKNKEK